MGWYALYTRPRHEKKVFDQLEDKGLEAFLPMSRELRQWKDRRKWVELPLFTGYVFVNIALHKRVYALQTHGVVRLVGFNGVPAEIPGWQIDQLQQVMRNTDSIRSEDYLRIGDLVEITAGPLSGVRGYLRETRGESRIAILIDGIHQSASFIVDRGFVKKLSGADEILEQKAV